MKWFPSSKAAAGDCEHGAWRPVGMESRRTYARKETAAVVTAACILIASLTAASGQAIDRCDPSSAKECYLKYRHAIWWEQFAPRRDGVYDDEQLKRGCSRIKRKIPCHENLVDCPEAVNGDYRIQERGYEAMSNIVCDSKILKDFHAGYQCRDEKKLDECAKAMSPAADPRNPRMIADNEGYCRLRNVEIACFEQAFNSSCRLPLKTAKTAITRVVDAISQLAGCPSSAHAAVASKAACALEASVLKLLCFSVLLVTPVILSWLRA